MNNQYLEPLLLIIVGICNLGFIVAIHIYEGKIKDIKHNLDAMNRRLKIAKDNVLLLDNQNNALKKQINVLKTKISGDESKLQYEYSYNIYGHTPYKNPYGPNLINDYNQDELDLDQ
jgi:hypothetical protein